MRGYVITLFALSLMAACKHQDSARDRSATTDEASPMLGVVEETPTETAVAMTMIDPCDANVVFFDAGMTQLDQAGKDRLTTLSQCIRKGGAREIIVVERGTSDREPNVEAELARQRAITVALYLRESGIDDSTIAVKNGDAEHAGEKLWPEAMATREE
jgi:outer membrane protein OmpA-like peptidoglycan-associated protein